MDKERFGSPETQFSSDPWLSSQERTWDEIDTVLEARLQGLQENFDGRPSRIAESYGIERGTGGNVARFLSYVELLDEYRQMGEIHQSRAEAARDQYEAKKTELKTSHLSQGKRQKQITDLWKNVYNPQVQNAQGEFDIYNNVHSLILRKATLDIFSFNSNTTQTQRPLLIDNFPRLINEAKEAIEKSKNEWLRDRKPVDYFLDKMSDYLSKTKDTSLFTRYNHRKSSGLVTTVEDCHVISEALDFSINAQTRTASADTVEQIARLGNAYISFLQRRAGFLSSLSHEGEYPHISIIYDIYTSALYNGKQSVVRDVSSLIDRNFGHLTHSTSLRRECKQLHVRRDPIVVNTYTILGDHPEILRLDPFDTSVVSFLPEEVINMFVVDEQRLFNGLWAVNHREEALQTEQVKKSKIVGAILGSVESNESSTKIDLHDQEYYDIREFISLLPNTYLLRQRGVEIDLNALLPATTAVDSQEEPSSILEVLEGLKFFIENDSGHDRLALSDLLTRQYLLNLFLREKIDTEKIEYENNFLWSEVLDNPAWFVSPRGDRFSRERDPQLAELGIDSITFNIDKGHPRDHRVTLKLHGSDFIYEYWLDVNRKLSNSARFIMSIDGSLQNTFSNILLKRLYYITSGLLSVGTDEALEHGDGTRETWYKRAHYRKLISTTTRPITMESPSAQLHAREIKDDYGIDIFREIARRRAIGTLRPSEFLTFVRETTPKIVAVNILPNEITFSPELIQIK